MSNIDRRENQADEEALLLPPREISFRSSHLHRSPSNASELSTLIPSILTPNHRESNPSGSSSSVISSIKAFRLAALLAGLSIAVLVFIDIDYLFGVARHGDVSAAAWQAERSVEVEGSDKTSKSDKKKKKKRLTKDEDEEDLETDQSGEVVETEPDDGGEYDDDDDMQEINSQVVDANSSSSGAEKSGEVQIPTPEQRCAYVVDTFEKQNEGFDEDFLRNKYQVQSADPNVFYRATALLFWQDFGTGIWGKNQNKSIVLDDLVMLKDATYEDGTPMSPMSTWTWVTGDQHLSNFGAWRNRAKDVVFSVNDFDEAAIYGKQTCHVTSLVLVGVF